MRVLMLLALLLLPLPAMMRDHRGPDPESRGDLFRAAQDEFGGVDVLILNASGGMETELGEGYALKLNRDAQNDTLTEALELANLYAPEHLCLLTRDPWSLLGQVRRAGGVFVGESSMEALGDYVAGPSHVMPTGGTARFMSPVNVRDFQNIISVVGINADTLRRIGPAAAQLARAEGLEAHARAVESRLK